MRICLRDSNRGKGERRRVSNMASIRQRGRNSWQITVSCGYKSNGQKDTKQMTVKRPEGLTDKQ